MLVLVYHKCSTCQKALKWLDEHKIFFECREKGMTVIVITHNSALTPMADRVIHIKNGTVSAMELNTDPTPVEEIEW